MNLYIEPCLEARRKVIEAEVHKSWQFLQTNDLELESVQILRPSDLAEVGR
jgi:hypothetical protein